MKKIITLAIAAGMFVAAAAPASAVDVKLDGTYTFMTTQRGWNNGTGVDDNGDALYSKDDRTWQRVDLGVTATVSENLSGYFQVRTDWQWGTNAWNGSSLRGDGFKDAFNNGDLGGSAKDDSSSLKVQLRQAYVDWIIPNTTVKVRMGRQPIRLPGLANGKNPAIWSKAPADGVVVSSPVTDWLSLTGFWARYARIDADGYTTYARDNGGFDVDNTRLSKEIDAFGIVADMKFDGFRFEPFVAYAHFGDAGQAGGNTNFANKFNNNFSPAGRSSAFWAGFAATLNMFDPFVAKLGFVYGDRNYTDKTPSQHGWLVDGKLSYKLDFMTPELLFWYGSGDSYQKGAYASHGYLPGIGGRFASTFGWGNGSHLEEPELYNNHSGAGTWGIRLGVSNVSFLEDLTHELYFAYISGTNDSACAEHYAKGNNPWRYMTRRDAVFEIDFGTKYNIYKNLTAALEVAYVFESFKKNNNGTFWQRANDYDNAWKACLQLQYKF